MTASRDIRKISEDIYRFARQNLYLNRSDLTVKGRRFNAALLWSLLTALGRGKALLVGEPGMGKTTAAEYVSVLVHGIPLGTVWQAEVEGHPEQTEEKIVGRPNLGKLNQGEEAVVWSFFAQLPVKIVDEINRLPETKQSLILNGMDRGKWTYLNEGLLNSDFCFFATANYADPGTNSIIAPLLDRFDIVIESKHPGANLAHLIGMNGAAARMLRHPELESEWQRLLSSGPESPESAAPANELRERLGEILRARLGIETPTPQELMSFPEQTAGIEFDLDANAYFRLLLSELSFCYPFGQKRSSEPCLEGCHFSGYMCHAVKNCISNRFVISVRHYAQMLAWFLGDSTVDLEHLRCTIPYVLAHRLQWQDRYIGQNAEASRSESLIIHMAKQAVSETHRRYMEQSDRIKSALATGFKIMEGQQIEPVEGDHPLFHEIKRDIAGA
ncbi:MAG: AAA family ATPase [Desulfobacteraceae bacterium]|nr:AAA family ATPase [Desulfobacteraceae bacterium]